MIEVILAQRCIRLVTDFSFLSFFLSVFCATDQTSEFFVSVASSCLYHKLPDISVSSPLGTRVTHIGLDTHVWAQKGTESTSIEARCG